MRTHRLRLGRTVVAVDTATLYLLPFSIWLLLHEFGHAAAARAFRFKVKAVLVLARKGVGVCFVRAPVDVSAGQVTLFFLAGPLTNAAIAIATSILAAFGVATIPMLAIAICNASMAVECHDDYRAAIDVLVNGVE